MNTNINRLGSSVVDRLVATQKVVSSNLRKSKIFQVKLIESMTIVGALWRSN